MNPLGEIATQPSSQRASADVSPGRDMSKLRRWCRRCPSKLAAAALFSHSSFCSLPIAIALAFGLCEGCPPSRLVSRRGFLPQGLAEMRKIERIKRKFERTLSEDENV